MASRPPLPRLAILVLSGLPLSLALSLAAACSSGESAGHPVDPASDAGPVAGEGIAPSDVPGSEEDAVIAPEGVARFPSSLPFSVTRADSSGIPPSAAEVEAFTRRMADFFRAVDWFAWTRRVSHGLDPSQAGEQVPYLFWWQDDDVVAVRTGDTVTFRHDGPSDNMMAHVGRVIGPVVGAYLSGAGTLRQHAIQRDLVLGYLRGVSALFDGNIWAEEDPVVPTVMARALFHRNHPFLLEGGRKAVVDYEPQRHEESQQRHDTVHNPANPAYGDVFVRTKRSKDDFPWIYRLQVHLARLLWSDRDAEVRAAAERLYGQLQAFAADIVDHGYIIRAKGAGGKVFIPWLDEASGTVDDFASLVEYEELLPNAECNAKLGVALIARGDPLGNDCGNGISEIYEEIAMARYYGHTWMQWGFHVSAVAVSLLYGAPGAKDLVSGLGTRLADLAVRDDPVSKDPRYPSDVAQLSVLAAAYGLPLTPAEARRILREYAAAADHYQGWDRWDLWRSDLPDGEYTPHPSRESVRDDGTTRTHVWIPEMANLFEYCGSPLRAMDGAPFLDCDLFLELLRKEADDVR